MFKKIIFLLFIAIISFSACSGDKEKAKFMNTYKEILIARSQIADSAQANKQVFKVLKSNGYTIRSFEKQWQEYASNPEEFIAMMDSIRTQAKDEILKQQAKKKP